MQIILENLYQVLESALPGQVSYGTRENINEANDYIVYQEISNRGIVYADDKVQMRIATIQVNLITQKKNLELEERLELYLYLSEYEFQMLSEYTNEDGSINRVYEIKLEVI